MGDAAMAISQEMGWPVFPVAWPLPDGRCSCGDPHTEKPNNIGKHPLIAGGFHMASQHPEQIGEWWDRWPMANIGFSPGSVGLLVLDIDGPEGEAFAQTVGALDVPTLGVETSRGRHLYFRLPDGVTIGNSHRADLDVRAHAGYVLLPPSLHRSGAVYAWKEADIADIPAALLDALLAQPQPAPTESRRDARDVPPGPRLSRIDQITERRILAYAAKVGYGNSDGRKRKAYLLSAFLQWDAGLAHDVAWECLRSWNEDNNPPLADDLLADIHANARKYARGAA